MMKKWTIFFLTGCIFLGGCSSQQEEENEEDANELETQEDTSSDQANTIEAISKDSFYFDTICSLTIYGIDKETFLESELWEEEQEASSEEETSIDDPSFEDAADLVISDAFSLCSDYESIFSRTKKGTDIWNINHAEGERVLCDERTIDMIQKGLEYGDLSNGKFDITIGPVEDLWGFQSLDEDAALPDEEELEEALFHVDYQKVGVDEEEGTVWLDDPEAEIDLGGIAKGAIADAVCERLKENGVTSAIVSLGGNIECVGNKPGEYGFQDNVSYDENTPFKIGIETPYSDRTEIVGYSEVSGGTMVTSGVYERYITVDGKEYHHILDPQTGYSVETDVLGVTIYGEGGTSADCDALSTICLMLGSEEGLSLMEEMDGFEAAFILEDGSVVTTTGMNFTAVDGE